MNSVAGDPASKMYAYDAGKRAIEDHFKRIGVKAKVEHTGLWGMYHVIYETPGNPLVSIIIPNKDHTDDLDKCVKSIINKNKVKLFLNLSLLKITVQKIKLLHIMRNFRKSMKM